MGFSWKSSWLHSRDSSPAPKNLKIINFVSLTIGKKRRNSSPKVAGLGSNPGQHLTPPPPPPRYLSLTDFWRLFSCQKEISKTSLTRFLTDIFGSLCDRNEHQSIFFFSISFRSHFLFQNFHNKLLQWSSIFGNPQIQMKANAFLLF